MNDKRKLNRSAAMLVASMLIFGSVGIVRRALPIGSGFLAFSRGLLGGGFLLLLDLLRGQGRGARLARGQGWRLALSGALIGINWILLFEAYRYTTVAKATLCYYMAPTIVLLLSPLLLRERLTRRKLLCALAALVGMVLVSGVAGEGRGAGDLRGILYGLAAALFYAAVVLMNKRLTGIPASQKTAVQLLSAAAVMVPYLLVNREGIKVDITPISIVLLLVLGLIHTGLAYLLYFGGMEGLPGQTVALLSYIDPVSALLFSAFLLGETLDPAGAVGAVLILGAALLSEKF